jgi:hypothetical protein
MVKDRKRQSPGIGKRLQIVRSDIGCHRTAVGRGYTVRFSKSFNAAKSGGSESFVRAFRVGVVEGTAIGPSQIRPAFLRLMPPRVGSCHKSHPLVRPQNIYVSLRWFPFWAYGKLINRHVPRTGY